MMGVMPCSPRVLGFAPALRVTPAMEAGLADHVWSVEELVGLLEQQEREAVEAGKLKRGAYGPRNAK